MGEQSGGASLVRPWRSWAVAGANDFPRACQSVNDLFPPFRPLLGVNTLLHPLWSVTKNLPLSRGHSGNPSPPEAHRHQMVSHEPPKFKGLVSRDRTNPHAERVCPVVEGATRRHEMSETALHRLQAPC